MDKVRDIKPSQVNRRLNLKEQRIVVIPLIKIVKTLAIMSVFYALILNPVVYAPRSGGVHAQEVLPQDSEEVSSEESQIAQDPQQAALRRKELEEELLRLEDQIKEQQQLIQEYRAQGQTLSSEIRRLNAEISKINLQIEAVNVSLRKLDDEIYQTQGEINRTQNKIEGHRQALAASLQRIYETDRQSLIAILLQNREISDFFNDINDILLVQDNIRLSLNDITKLRQKLIEQKQELSLEKSDVEQLKAIREAEKNRVRSVQNQKANLLEVTKNKESEYQKLLAETQKTAAQIRSQIFRLIGGGELTFERAYELARLAESATGIRAALTLAILDRESLLGQNVGRCEWQTAMNPDKDIPVFKVILATLGIEQSSTITKVSCPNQHGTYGGAMGPAQFIPSTWAIYGGYEKSGSGWRYNSAGDLIGKIVGNKPSNPWSNADAFVATALYLNDLYNSSSCKDYAASLRGRYPEQELREECAAAQYYSGSRWRRYYTWYGIPVVERANEFQRDIDILNS